MHRKRSPSSYLIKLVHIVGQQVDDLARGCLPHGHVTKTECLEEKKKGENRIAIFSPPTS